MTEPESMDQSAIDDFLGTGGTCVVALARDDQPYAAPVSYGYDADSEAIYLRLGAVSDSEKVPFVRGGATARVVVYEVTPEATVSVIAEGPITEVASDDLDPEIVELLAAAELPHFELWPADKPDIEFTIVHVEAKTLTGRRATASDG